MLRDSEKCGPFVIELLSRPWPWYVAGPLMGLMVPLLLLIGNRAFGISSTLRHICAACVPGRTPFFRYDWKKELWSLTFAAGIVLGGVLGGIVFRNPAPVALSTAARDQLASMGVTDLTGLHPAELFTFQSLASPRGLLLIVVGGFLVGFGTRYANGCTSGHSITGMASLNWPSFVATAAFFAGGLVMTWLILPRILAL
jgi:uncharacterized membrane protein YedE/YeeE